MMCHYCIADMAACYDEGSENRKYYEKLYVAAPKTEVECKCTARVENHAGNCSCQCLCPSIGTKTTYYDKGEAKKVEYDLNDKGDD